MRQYLVDFFDEFEYECADAGRLFDTQEMNPRRLPQDGSLRRAYAEHLMNGGRVGWGYGIKM